jgi:hypothetical protein
MLAKDVWISIGFLYNPLENVYYLIKEESGTGLCLSCASTFSHHPRITNFCFRCREPNPLQWTTGNNSLDSLLRESWRNMNRASDSHIRWIGNTRLTHVREAKTLPNGCTHVAIGGNRQRMDYNE